jgi:REP element-mobilizing transposase RayT
MKNKSQLSLIPNRNNRRFFGGALLKGRRKSRRPLSSKEAIHVVLRSTFAGGKYSFLIHKNHIAIEKILGSAVRKYGIKIYRHSIQTNHIHLILKIQDRWSYRCFIATISGKIASLIMGYKSFKDFKKSLWGEGPVGDKKSQGFWEFRPFTRILYWGKDYQACCRYVLQNTLEALGFIQYKVRRNFYQKFLVAPS